ncbi:MAG: toxin TcdB middle/C-terminal domain-containing protein, partial [Anaerolineae bacterium]
GQKPHLLTRVVNNLGAETRVHYTPSTKFYLQDQQAGREWITRLHFPVHVVERVETYDRISRNRFVTRYAYHHGYFDGQEREFRGFGMVEQRDTEQLAVVGDPADLSQPVNQDPASHVPPVLTRTWYHTGAYLQGARISLQFKDEYYQEPGSTAAEADALLLPDTILPPGLSAEEQREACRALKGSVLRQEVYALDGTDKQAHPYSVTERNYGLRLIQPMADNPHAVFLVHGREDIQYHYERNPADPRVSHALTLQVDDFGNVLRAAAIGYGRRRPDPDLQPQDQRKQTQTLITLTENGLTHPIQQADAYRTPLGYQTRTYELTGLLRPAARQRFSFAEIADSFNAAQPLDYADTPTEGMLEKRLIEQMRTLYRRDDLTGPLPPGELQSLALPYESYQLAFTPGLIAAVYDGRVDDRQLQEGGYVRLDGQTGWWIPSGQTCFSPNPDDAPADELAQARAHFFLPRRYRDPFGAVTTVRYDEHDLLLVETQDAIGNRVTVGERDPAGHLTKPGNDYRVLQPRLMMDANRNRAEVAFDTLGL